MLELELNKMYNHDHIDGQTHLYIGPQPALLAYKGAYISYNTVILFLLP